MAETSNLVPSLTAGKDSHQSQMESGAKPTPKRGPPLHEIYALPAPIKTFPLPVFYPNNPISLFHVAYAWLCQTLSPPPAEPAVVHHGVWSDVTTSVQIHDEKAMRALWEQGFYGKGSLSRSEPNWLKREQVRQGLQEAHVSEILTVQRREERNQAKWERARLEQEAIRQTRLEEARLAEERRLANSADPSNKIKPVKAPVGPLEILALPNSSSELGLHLTHGHYTNETAGVNGTPNGVPTIPGLSHLKLLAHDQPSNAAVPLDDVSLGDAEATNGMLAHDSNEPLGQCTSETQCSVEQRLAVSPSPSSGSSETKSLKIQKSVRFSPTIESTTFQLSDPPSPNLSVAAGKTTNESQTNGNVVVTEQVPRSTADKSAPKLIVNKEHLQLTPEEAFFLAFGLGVLTVTDPWSGMPLSTTDMFKLFRQHSYFPPRIGPDEPALQPDDGFLVNYAAYHHYRSLGWVPRPGIKFSVDWLLYTRGPVFDHAQFGLILVPSYSDAWWKKAGHKRFERTWYWLHNIVRVLSHVMKSVVLVYVDVPPPPKFDEALEQGMAEALKLYKIREVMVKRWSSNRNR